MKNIIMLSTVAAFTLIAGVASASPVTSTEKTDTKTVVSTGKDKKVSHESKVETKTEAAAPIATPATDVKAEVKTDVKSDTATTVPSKVETPAPTSAVVPESK